MINSLEKRVNEGENRLRRVLARIRLHQGRTDDALMMELKYIEQADFGKLTAARRRGQGQQIGRGGQCIRAGACAAVCQDETTRPG
ncbi:MAG: hypothetical protein ABGX07_13085, partial [Pirellulaceae bacterium]